MQIDPNQKSLLIQLNKTFMPLLVEIANEVKKDCDSSKQELETIDKTLMNFIKQDGMIKGIDLYLETLNTLIYDQQNGE